MTQEQVGRARRLDLLSYLAACEPWELVRCGNGSYRTRTHDSLEISNGLWHWHSRGIGGRSALDYLMHVRGMDFVAAVQTLCEGRAADAPTFMPEKRIAQPFALPECCQDSARVVRYLAGRGIAREVIDACLQSGDLYESLPYHNAVFVGRDAQGTPRYAMQRSTEGRPFKLEAAGSDKRFTFSIPGTEDALAVTEGAIDALSVATLSWRWDGQWRRCHYLSLGGISAQQNALPAALAQYLHTHGEVRRVCLMLDNDPAGRSAAERIYHHLQSRYEVSVKFPTFGKDFNDHIRFQKCRQAKTHREQER